MNSTRPGTTTTKKAAGWLTQAPIGSPSSATTASAAGNILSHSVTSRQDRLSYLEGDGPGKGRTRWEVRIGSTRVEGYLLLIAAAILDQCVNARRHQRQNQRLIQLLQHPKSISFRVRRFPDRLYRPKALREGCTIHLQAGNSLHSSE